MAKQVPLDAPWRAPKAAEWDSQTVATWINKHTHTGGAKGFFELICEGVWAAQPADLSLLHFLFYVHSGGGIDMLISTDGGAQQHRIVGGSQQIAISAAERLGDRILFSSPVRRIIDDGESVAIQADDVEVQAAHVIVAIPPTLTGRIDYQPALPGWRDQLTQRIPQGSVIKCMAVYDEPFWRSEGFSGQVTSTDGPVKVVFDNTPPDSDTGVLLGFLEGEQARTLGRLPLAERRDAVIAVLRALLRTPRRQPERLHREVLGGRALHPRLLRRLLPARRLDHPRLRPAHPLRTDPLGRRRDRRGLERLHGRRDQLRRTRSHRSHRRRRRSPPHPRDRDRLNATRTPPTRLS